MQEKIEKKFIFFIHIVFKGKTAHFARAFWAVTEQLPLQFPGQRTADSPSAVLQSE